jgi:hypothetical protein
MLGQLHEPQLHTSLSCLQIYTASIFSYPSPCSVCLNRHISFDSPSSSASKLRKWLSHSPIPRPGRKKSSSYACRLCRQLLSSLIFRHPRFDVFNAPSPRPPSPLNSSHYCISCSCDTMPASWPLMVILTCSRGPICCLIVLGVKNPPIPAANWCLKISTVPT